MAKQANQNIPNIKGVKPTGKPEILFPVAPYDERYITSRYGYQVEIKDTSGTWLKEIIWPDDVGAVTRIQTGRFFTGIPEIDRITSAFLYFLLKHYDGKSINHYGKGVELYTSEIIQGRDIEEALNQAVLHISRTSELTAIKALVKWFIAYELEGLSYDLAHEVQKLSRGSEQNQYASLFTLDAELGPFVREEMLILQQALNDPHIHLEDRVILGLCMTFGLRPVQISLLKQSDFVEHIDMGICYLNVPRVKQHQQKRRRQFTKRILSPEFVALIKELISTHQQIFYKYDIQDPPLIMRRYNLYNGNHPYKEPLTGLEAPKGRNPNWTENIAPTQPYQHLFDASDKSDFGHHVGTVSIDYRLKCIVEHLPNSPRTEKPFNLTPYRFRYTVGTNAVSEGMLEAEVADLLDHSNIGSVKHYFRYTSEMNEVLNKATNKRIEQRHFVAAWTREGDQTGNIYGEVIVELRHFTAIGKCHKGSACILEPAVACYQCHKFCPSKDSSSHKNALENLLERVEELKATSTGAAIHQLDEAVAGCMAAIAYSEGEEVIFITAPELQEAGDVLGVENE